MILLVGLLNTLGVLVLVLGVDHVLRCRCPTCEPAPIQLPRARVRR